MRGEYGHDLRDATALPVSSHRVAACVRSSPADKPAFPAPRIATLFAAPCPAAELPICNPSRRLPYGAAAELQGLATIHATSEIVSKMLVSRKLARQNIVCLPKGSMPHLLSDRMRRSIGSHCSQFAVTVHKQCCWTGVTRFAAVSRLPFRNSVVSRSSGTVAELSQLTWPDQRRLQCPRLLAAARTLSECPKSDSLDGDGSLTLEL